MNSEFIESEWMYMEFIESEWMDWMWFVGMWGGGGGRLW